MSTDTGIYRIHNTLNGKSYVGSAVSFKGRFASHLCTLKGQKHANKKLQRAWDKYGESSFIFEKLFVCEKKDLIFYEQRAIDIYDAVKVGYNIAPIAGNTLGVKKSEDERRRISESHKGKTVSIEARAKMAAAQLGRKHSESTLIKMSEVQKARWDRGENTNWSFAGGKHTDEAKAKISIARTGIPLSDETKAKISAAGKGKTLSAEHKAKIAAAHKGKKLTKEHILNSSLARRGIKPSAESIAKRLATMAKNKELRAAEQLLLLNPQGEQNAA